MAITRTITDLGRVRGAGGRGAGGGKMLHGQYATEAGDTYSTATRCTLTFNHVNRVEKVLGLFSDATGYVPKVYSISGNIVTIALYWGGGAGAALTEVTHATTINAINLYCSVLGN